MLDLVLFLRGNDAVLEGDLLRIVNIHSFADAIEANAVEEDVVYRKTCETREVKGFAGVHAGDIAEREIAPFGIELTLIIRVSGTATSGRTIGVA